MAEPNDLVDKLEDSREIVLELINQLTVNPVTLKELSMIGSCTKILNNIKSAIGKGEELVENWEEE